MLILQIALVLRRRLGIMQTGRRSLVHRLASEEIYPWLLILTKQLEMRRLVRLTDRALGRRTQLARPISSAFYLFGRIWLPRRSKISYSLRV